MDKINVFILAAGLGERLQSITQHIPKPLLPVLGKPIIHRILDKVEKLSIDKVGINLHYKKDHILKWIDQSNLKGIIRVFPEGKILGTGGALKNAESLLAERSFLVHNSDILSDVQLEDLLARHFTSGNIATLAIHDYPKFNSLILDENGFLNALSQGKSDNLTKWAFTGIAVYSPVFLDYLPEGMSGVVDAWQRAIKSGQKIGTYNVSGCKWNDIGTPSAYSRAVFDELKNEGEIVYVHPSSRASDKIDMKGFVVIEGECDIQNSIELRNCILLPGADISSNEGTIENCIIGPDFTIQLDLTEIPVICGVNGRQFIGTGGSDRKYYRIRTEDNSQVMMQCSIDDQEYNRHLEYSKFFNKCNIPVPRLLSASEDKKLAIFEDVGDISLYSYLKYPRSSHTIEALYKKVIDVLVMMHLDATERINECQILKSRLFDHDYFMWETEYFLENYVKRVKNISSESEEKIDYELESLAARADSYQKTVIHRDFQSQNIMVMSGHRIWIIDYQGARIGPPAYDIASLLWDPYLVLDEGMQDSLLAYYAEKLNNSKLDIAGFYDSLLTCRLQRHMQALGAYGFLSHEKGKRYFLKHIPQGLRLLKDDISLEKESYPELFNLIMSL